MERYSTSTILVFIYLSFISMVKKKLKSSIVSFGKTVIAAPGEGEGETTMFPDQPTENNIYAGEEFVVADNPPNTLGTRADEAAADARKKLGLESNESTTSYAET